jgi:hypothetical protein
MQMLEEYVGEHKRLLSVMGGLNRLTKLKQKGITSEFSLTGHSVFPPVMILTTLRKL